MPVKEIQEWYTSCRYDTKLASISGTTTLQQKRDITRGSTEICCYLPFLGYFVFQFYFPFSPLKILYLFAFSVLTQMSFQSHRLLYSHASAEVRGENTPERNFLKSNFSF